MTDHLSPRDRKLADALGMTEEFKNIRRELADKFDGIKMGAELRMDALADSIRNMRTPLDLEKEKAQKLAKAIKAEQALPAYVPTEEDKESIIDRDVKRVALFRGRKNYEGFKRNLWHSWEKLQRLADPKGFDVQVIINEQHGKIAIDIGMPNPSEKFLAIVDAACDKIGGTEGEINDRICARWSWRGERPEIYISGKTVAEVTDTYNRLVEEVRKQANVSLPLDQLTISSPLAQAKGR